MKKIVKKSLIVLMLIYVLFSNTIYAATGGNITNNNTNATSNIQQMARNKTPQVDNTKKVYDIANLLTTEQEQNLYNNIKEFINKYNMDMVVVTISENNKSSAMAYADDFYDYNNFGEGSNKSGLLFLIDMDTREMWISTTGSAIKMYNDTRIDSILDYTYKKISKKDYYGCASEFVKYAKYFAEEGLNGTNRIRSTAQKVLFVIGIPIIVTVGMVIYGVFRHRNVRKQQMAKAYILNDSVQINNMQDNFVSTHTTKVKIETSSGGSSTHIGSSGSSHGGGGRSF